MDTLSSLYIDDEGGGMTQPLSPSVIGGIIAQMSDGMSFVADTSLDIEVGDIEAHTSRGEPADNASFGTHIREAIRTLRPHRD